MSVLGDGQPPSLFPTTQWTALLEPLRGQDTRARLALESLCRTYWKPIYGFVRGRGYQHHEAEELVQEFVMDLLEGDALTTVHRDKGRFRAFLLACLRNFLNKRYVHDSALKRGGGRTAVPWEEVEAVETPLATEDAREFDVAFACRLLEEAMHRLRRESAATGKSEFFEDIHPHIAGQGVPIPRADIARKYALGVNAVDVAIHRARKRYGLLLRELVKAIVGSEEEVEEELQYLIRCLNQTGS